MNLGLSILVWLIVIAIVFVFLTYGFAFIFSIFLMIKNKRDFEKTKIKHREEFDATVKHNEEKMKQFREKHFKE
ncbi:hypothetical protein [Staphylococcus xylosus]|uniref:hypothetical protein n=1 Tax=Staphylococcus xylosus TaxID=1288 RepID=UPI0015C57891|nr:hypothetical protein [Staphylococcus xylosus]NQD99781.1 hypothetical protein [Staphylococcus xylosus]